MENRKTLFKLPLINIWYVVLALIFILMQALHIIDWNVIWLLSPLWLPWTFALIMIIVPYTLLGIIWIIDKIYKCITKLRRK